MKKEESKGYHRSNKLSMKRQWSKGREHAGSGGHLLEGGGKKKAHRSPSIDSGRPREAAGFLNFQDM
jgi:hypothetical protein